MEFHNLQSIVETLVFVSDHPITFRELQVLLGEVSKEDLEAVLKKIKAQYEQNQHGIYLEEVAGGYQFRTKLSNASWVQKLFLERPAKLTRSQLEALAIVAYRQPVTRIDVDLIRGVESTHILKMLLDKKLIKIAGVKESPGRPLLYATTPEFLEFFNLKGLEALPSLESLKELASTQDLPLFSKESLKQEELVGDYSSNSTKSSTS